jgi:hypothetical protein
MPGPAVQDAVMWVTPKELVTSPTVSPVGGSRADAPDLPVPERGVEVE